MHFLNPSRPRLRPSRSALCAGSAACGTLCGLPSVLHSAQPAPPKRPTPADSARGLTCFRVAQHYTTARTAQTTPGYPLSRRKQSPVALRGRPRWCRCYAVGLAVSPSETETPHGWARQRAGVGRLASGLAPLCTFRHTASDPPPLPAAAADCFFPSAFSLKSSALLFADCFPGGLCRGQPHTAFSPRLRLTLFPLRGFAAPFHSSPITHDSSLPHRPLEKTNRRPRAKEVGLRKPIGCTRTPLENLPQLSRLSCSRFPKLGKRGGVFFQTLEKENGEKERKYISSNRR